MMQKADILKLDLMAASTIYHGKRDILVFFLTFELWTQQIFYHAYYQTQENKSKGKSYKLNITLWQIATMEFMK